MTSTTAFMFTATTAFMTASVMLLILSVALSCADSL